MISRALSDLAILELAATELHVYNSTDEALRQHYCVHIQQGHPQRTYCPAVFMRNSLCSRSARSSGALLDIVFPLPRAPDNGTQYRRSGLHPEMVASEEDIALCSSCNTAVQRGNRPVLSIAAGKHFGRLGSLPMLTELEQRSAPRAQRNTHSAPNRSRLFWCFAQRICVRFLQDNQCAGTPEVFVPSHLALNCVNNCGWP